MSSKVLYFTEGAYVSMYKWIMHDQSDRQQGAIYKLDWEGIYYNKIDTTSFMLGNRQSIFLPTKIKRFYK